MFDIHTKQKTNTVLMVRPANFGYNPETAESNAFQQKDKATDKEKIQKQALKEFDTLVNKLRTYEINVKVIEDTPKPKKTDAIFPNNWITTHESGVLVTYPMLSPKRRKERRKDIVNQLDSEYKITRQYSFDHYEDKEMYLEGTGSMVLDRPNKIAYACLSERTNIKVLEKFAVLSNYRKIVFHATDPYGLAIYHTNVIMSVCDQFAIICLDCISDEKERAELTQSLAQTGKEIVNISFDQVNAFAGNMLQLAKPDGSGLLVMSESAFRCLEPEQINQIKQYTDFLYAPIPTIEKIGGGSVRCMIAEIFMEAKETV